MTTPSKVTVALKSNSYDILIGDNLLEVAGEVLRERFGSRRIFIVTEDRVAGLYLDRLRRSLSAAHYEISEITVQGGESSKEFHVLQGLIDGLLEAGVARDSLIIAFGGGVIGDLVGFAASILLRGVDYVQIPTTLLAQVDSAVGGKTGINSPLGKNLIGSFHQPKLVLSDTLALDSLPKRELLAGYAEVVKYSLIGNAKFFGWLEENGVALVSGQRSAREHAVKTCCEMKAKIVSKDEREDGQRLLLNLGHTFGHAFEADLDFDSRLLHGEAVAIGSLMAFDLSARLGYCAASALEQVRLHYEKVELPTLLPCLNGHVWSAERFLSHMTRDKKVRNGKKVLILLRGIGEAFVNDQVAESSLLDVLEAYIDS